MTALQHVWYLAPIAMLVPLTACAVNSPAEIRASDGRLTQAAAISLSVTEGEPPLNRDFRLALGRAFAAQNTVIDDNAPLVGDFGISAVDATVGQIVDPAGQGSNAPLDWQAEPRRGLMLDSCKPIRAQATLAIFDRAKGEMVYRGEATATVCETSEADLGALAKRLVDDSGLGAVPTP